MNSEHTGCPFCWVEARKGITQKGILAFGMLHGAAGGPATVKTVCVKHAPTFLAGLMEYKREPAS
jgi:hypothetical protein